MSRRLLSITALAVALSLAPAAGAGASTGPARGGVGDAWGPVQVPAKVGHAAHRAHRTARDHRHR